jgi:hypothetical protein
LVERIGHVGTPGLVCSRPSQEFGAA